MDFRIVFSSSVRKVIEILMIVLNKVIFGNITIFAMSILLCRENGRFFHFKVFSVSFFSGVILSLDIYLLFVRFILVFFFLFYDCELWCSPDFLVMLYIRNLMFTC